jgi:hypothetical protein
MPIKVDGTWTTALAIDKPKFSQPIPGVNVDYVLEQTFVILNSSYAPLGLNTAHPNFGTFLLVEEGPRQPLGQGIVKWVRKYAKVPSQFHRLVRFRSAARPAGRSANRPRTFHANSPVQGAV